MDNKNLRTEIAEILRDGITPSAQLGDYVIHGAINNLIKLIEREANSSRAEILGHDTPFPLEDVLTHLINATDILLHKKDYDGGDYEEMERSVKRAKDIIALLRPIKINHP